ncbi:hypothetical protein HPULCUR_007414 [Helicostylum pulchrum]|uniref:Uncharacterized protein n=1 Tax=Helicostylum pulchrum TaxID=562976 RepID=A0ABP9Y4R2_9FUNG
MKLLSLGCLLLVSYAHAFCVYNFTDDDSVWVRQMPRFTGGTYTSRFKHENIGPGDSQCCHFSIHDCNTTGDPNTILQLAFQTTHDGVAKDFMFTVTLPAGGWVEIRGESGASPEAFVFTDVGDKYDHEFINNPRGVLLLK